MSKRKLVCMAIATALSSSVFAGGLLTNTNTNIAFNRNFAREGVIAIDGVYSNPAGVAFLSDGWHFSINNQSAFQTRTIRSSITVPAFEGTPFYQPFKLNGGDEKGFKEFKGKATAPILPSFQVAYNKGKWGFQGSFALVGGGGKCTFNHGLGSFERTISLLPALLYGIDQKYRQFPELEQTGLGLATPTPGYTVDSYIHGQQYVFGMQFGVTRKLTDNLSVYGGFRFNYIWNKYKGNIRNISTNIGGVNERLVDYIDANSASLGNVATILANKSISYQQLAEQATTAGNTAAAQQYAAAAAKYAEGAQGIQQVGAMKGMVADRYLDCTQTGWAICPIIGVDYRWNKLNIGARLEFTTHFNIQNDTKVDDTGMFADGVNTPGDMPGIFTIGAQYEVLPQWRVMGGYHLYFDKNAKMADDKQKALTGNTQEFTFGTEYDITDAITVSAGGQKTDYRLGNGAYLNDMSFVTDSWSFGFGAKVKVAKKVSVNVAYFWTNYSHFNKEYDQEISVAGQTIQAKCADDFTRTNRVFGVGVDFDL